MNHQSTKWLEFIDVYTGKRVSINRNRVLEVIEYLSPDMHRTTLKLNEGSARLVEGDYEEVRRRVTGWEP